MKKTNLLTIAVLFCAAAVGFCATPPVADGLIMQFDAGALNLNDGDAVALWPDLSGNGNNAVPDTETNMPVYHAAPADFICPALYFDGTDDFLRLPSPAPFSVDSASAVVYAQYEANKPYEYMIAGQDGSGDDRFRMAFNNQYMFQAGDSSLMRTSYSAKTARTFALTSGNGEVKGYIDTNLLVTGSNSSSEVPVALNIGSYNCGQDEHFKGHIAKVYFYDRGLSEAEMLAVRAFIFDGIPLNMVPADGADQVLIDTPTLVWDTPQVDSPVTGYNIVMRTTDPNFADEANNLVFENVADLNADEAIVEVAMPISLGFLTTYYWRVDTVTADRVYEGSVREFLTAPNDVDPIIDAGGDYTTWISNLPFSIEGTVDDNGEGDISDSNIEWSIVSYPGDPTDAAMQLMYRAMESQAAADLKLLGYDPNTLAEWIGTDTRQPGNPLSLTLSGLPAGTYTWTSLHHDYNDARGTFNVYVNDVLAGENLVVSTASAIPTQFATQFTTDGSDVKFVFDKIVDESTSDYMFFAMNAFTLTDGISTINVDFDNLTSTTAADYVSYKAEHEVPGSFTAQSFPFGAATVSVLPQWGPNAAGLIEGAQVAKTSTDPLAPAAEFTTLSAGAYVIELSVTDNAGHNVTDTMTVNVAQDACAAAQTTAEWAGFNYFDTDLNCVIDLNDFAAFAASWLTDLSAAGSFEY
ncbi:MAG: LamG-like jellyroll fold domain-containing protein [Phycisphaerae bacterium]